MTDHLLRGRYQFLEAAGRGGEGEVSKMIDLVHGRQLALKARRLESGADRDRLLSEARILLDMRPHPNLPTVREDFVDGDVYFLAMDWIEGRSLRQVLEEDGFPGLALQQVLGYIEQAAAAVDHLHDHDPPIIHLDVKPANLILTPDGRVVLVDFGISSRRQPQQEGLAGTRDYAPPELRTSTVTPAADIYGLAATAYALLTGAPPKAEVKPRLPDLDEAAAVRILQAIRRGLATNPRFRPASGAGLVEAIRSACPDPHPTSIGHRPRRRHGAAAAAVALGICLVGAAAWLKPADDPKLQLASVALDAKHSRLYRAGSGGISIIDGDTGKEQSSFSLPSSPRMVVTDPDSGDLYVGDSQRRLSVIDAATHQVRATIPLTFTPTAVAVNPTTRLVYVAGRGPDTLIALDAATHALVATMRLDAAPLALAVDPATNQIYVVAQAPDSLLVIDGTTAAPRLVASVPVGPKPCGIAVSPNLHRIYVTTRSGSVDVLQGATPEFAGLTAAPLQRIAVPVRSCAIALNPRTNRAYVTGGRGTVTVADLITNTVTRRRSRPGEAASEISEDPVAQRLYVVNRGSHRLVVLDETTLEAC